MMAKETQKRREEGRKEGRKKGDQQRRNFRDSDFGFRRIEPLTVTSRGGVSSRTGLFFHSAKFESRTFSPLSLIFPRFWTRSRLLEILMVRCLCNFQLREAFCSSDRGLAWLDSTLSTQAPVHRRQSLV